MTMIFDESALFVEFSDGDSLLKVLADPMVMRVADRVIYRGRDATAAFSYSTASAPLDSYEARNNFRTVLARFGVEPQAVLPRAERAEDWQRTSDVLIGLELVDQREESAAGIHLIAAHTPTAMQLVCDTLLNMKLPFELGAVSGSAETIPEHWFAFARVDLRGPGMNFIREYLQQKPDITVFTEAWVHPNPHVELFVTYNQTHPAEHALRQLCHYRPDMFDDCEIIACGACAPLRMQLQPGALLQYPRSVRVKTSNSLSRVLSNTAADAQTVAQRLRQIDRQDLKIDIISRKTASHTVHARTRSELETEASHLRTQMIRAQMRLEEVEHALGNMPMAYVRRRDDDSDLVNFLRHLPVSVVQELVLTMVSDPNDSGVEWLILLGREPGARISLPRRLLSGWICCVGHCIRPDEVPVVYLPENYQFRPDFALLNAGDVEEVFHADGGSRDARRILLPCLPKARGSWSLFVIPEASCTSLSESAYALVQDLWQPWLAPLHESRPNVPDSTPALDHFEEQFTSQVHGRMEKISQHIDDIRERADNLVKALTCHETSLAKLEEFDQRMTEGVDLSDVLTGLVNVIEAFASTHQRLAQKSRDAHTAYQEWRGEIETGERDISEMEPTSEDSEGSAS